jgi:YD repeat-containing protein
VIRWADGTVEEFHGAVTEPALDLPSEYAIPDPFTFSCTATQDAGDLRKIDRNGNITTFRFSATPDGLSVQTVIDPQGRETKAVFDRSEFGVPRLLSVEMPSIGRAPKLEYTVEWGTKSIKFRDIWPDVSCSPESGTALGCSVPYTVDVVSSVTIPDGRQYVFEYGPWGNLENVTVPDGAFYEYEYGDATNLAYAQAATALFNRLDSDSECGTLWSGQAVKMQARGMVAERTFPMGRGSNRSFVRNQTYASQKVADPTCRFDELGAALQGPDACSQVWMETTERDGTTILRKVKRGTAVRALPKFVPNDEQYAQPPLVPIEIHGRHIGEEILSADDVLIRAEYNGDKLTGQLWYDFDIVKTRRMPVALTANLRPTKKRTLLDGLITTTNFVYNESIDIDPTGGEERRTTEVTSTCTFAGAVHASGCGAASPGLLARTETTHKHIFDGTFASRLLLNLPTSTRMFGASGSAPATETIYAYDESPLEESGLPSEVLDPTLGRAAGSPRGNLTTITRRVTATKSVSDRTTYFDQGAIRSAKDAKGNESVFDPDFTLCNSGTAVTLTSRVTNALGHTAMTISDCASGAVLVSTDANGKSTYSQYDSLARPVETAAPGDVLSALQTSGADPFTRAPDAPTGGGSVPGAAAVTSWTEYVQIGIPGRQRTITHVRDGSPGGSYAKSFFDGLGRVTQTRAKADKNKSTFDEIVTTTAYDDQGQVIQSLVACYATVSDSVTPHCATAGTMTSYDAVGRELRVTRPGNRVTTHSFGNENGLWLRTTINPRGFTTKTYTDLLGRQVRVDQESPRCGGFCTTRSNFDVAGRLLEVVDHLGNRIVYKYDDLGRTTEMSDPDMGVWSYTYEDNGNLESRTDAKGQKISFVYDALNRVKRKDVPPSGPSPEDVTYFYDGDGPQPPAENKVPTLTALTPSTAVAGSPQFDMAVDGANFLTGAVVTFNGQSRPTTVVSGERLSAAIAASDIQVAGAYSVTVINPGATGGTSATATFSVTSAPRPTLTTIAPPDANRGSGSLTLTVNGSNFVSGAIVTFGGQNRQTDFISAERVTALIPASDVQTAGTYPVTVVNPIASGGASAATTFTVKNLSPTLASISPVSALRGTTTFTLTASGSNFAPGAIVRFDGQNRQTIVDSAQQVRADILESEISTAGAHLITVVNPAPGGGTSQSLTFTVTSAAPAISSLTPPSIPRGFAKPFSLTVNGSNFVSGAVVSFNGQARPATFVSATELTASVSPSEIQTAGMYPVKVVNPDGMGGSSAAVTFTVTNPVPGITSMDPASVAKGSALSTLTVYGSNFVNGATVTFNGQSRQTSFITSTQLKASILATDLQATGAYPVHVINPGPGGGVSGGVTFAVTNAPTTLGISRPANGSVFAAPATIPIEATATDADGIKQVEFYQDTTLLFTDTTAPYGFNWNEVAAGSYRISVVATDVTNTTTTVVADVVVENADARTDGTARGFVLSKTVGTPRRDSPGLAGMKIRIAAQSLSLQSLGRLCVSGNSGAHDLKVIRVSDNATLASVSASMAGCTAGAFKYMPLSAAVTLVANTDYLIVSNEVGADYFHDWTGTWLTTTGVAAIKGAAYTTDGGKTWGVATGSGNSYVPVDFQYIVPPTRGFVTARTLGSVRRDSPGLAGFKFTTSADPITIDTLGRLCASGNSLPHDLKLIRVADNVTLGTVSVAMSGCTAGEFKYAILPTAVTLAANTDYLIVSHEVGNDLFHDWTGTWLTTMGVATIKGAVYTTDGGKSWGVVSTSGNSYVPLDFQYVVPATRGFVTGRRVGGLRRDSPGLTGFKFKTNADPVAVDALGRLCVSGNSLPHDLKLIRAADNVTLGTATVSLSGCAAGEFKYATLAKAVMLAANTDYFIVSNEVGNDYFHDWTGTWLTTTGVATIKGAAYTTDGGKTWGVPTSSGNSYVPLDFRYVAPPPKRFVISKTTGPMVADAVGLTGMKIGVGAQALQVETLGRLCIYGNSGSHDLKLIRVSDNATLATTSVAMAGCTVGAFKYSVLPTVVTLAPNTDYLVVSNEVGGDAFHLWVDTTVTTTSAATVRHAIYTQDGGLTWQPAGSTGSTYVPVDFQYSVSPSSATSAGTSTAAH